MSELSTLARPYAEAVFRLAQGDGNLADWSDRLAMLDQIVRDPAMAGVIADPSVSAERVAGLIGDVAGGALGEQGNNLVGVLAQNDRLALVPEIHAQFEALKASAEGTLDAVITSALPLTPEQIQELVSGLKARFGREVQATVETDPALIGGAVITIGDQVIDGSVKGRLEKMAFALQG